MRSFTYINFIQGIVVKHDIFFCHSRLHLKPVRSLETGIDQLNLCWAGSRALLRIIKIEGWIPPLKTEIEKNGEKILVCFSRFLKSDATAAATSSTPPSQCVSRPPTRTPTSTLPDPRPPIPSTRSAPLWAARGRWTWGTWWDELPRLLCELAAYVCLVSVCLLYLPLPHIMLSLIL